MESKERMTTEVEESQVTEEDVLAVDNSGEQNQTVEEDDDEDDTDGEDDDEDEDDEDIDKAQEGQSVNGVKKYKVPLGKKTLPGIVYLGHIPPRLRPKHMRNMLGVYGEIGRVFLQPEGEYTSHGPSRPFQRLSSDY